MSDLFFGRTCSEAYKCISAGAAATFTFNFQPDKVVFNNLSDWAATAGNLPKSTWFRDQTTAAHAYQQQVIDSAAGSSFNFLDLAANGFTVADTDGGVPAFRANISAVTQANPCVVTTAAVHGFQTNQIVRITDLGDVGVSDRGMAQINNKRFMLVVIDTTSFSLKDPVTDEAIDSSAFTAYVSGGRCVLESRVLTLNNPQVSPYSEANPYNPNPYEYDPIEYKLTAGTSVMGADGDVFLIEAFKWGQLYDLGDLGA